MHKFSYLSALALTACVTINIYFPAAAAEKAADQIIQDIQKPTTPDTHDDSRASNGGQLSADSWQYWVESALDVVISPAHAEGANLNIDSAEIRQLQASMQKRFSTLLPFYQQGQIGIQRDGMLAVVNPANVPLKDRNSVTKLISAENNDRISLYKAIANANGHPDWFDDIKATFAQRWIGNAQSGWSYQTANGEWVRK